MHEPIEVKCTNSKCTEHNKSALATLEGIFFDDKGGFHKQSKDCRICLSPVKITQDTTDFPVQFNMKNGLSKEIKLISGWD